MPPAPPPPPTLTSERPPPLPHPYPLKHRAAPVLGVHLRGTDKGKYASAGSGRQVFKCVVMRIRTLFAVFLRFWTFLALLFSCPRAWVLFFVFSVCFCRLPVVCVFCLVTCEYERGGWQVRFLFLSPTESHLSRDDIP